MGVYRILNKETLMTKITFEDFFELISLFIKTIKTLAKLPDM